MSDVQEAAELLELEIPDGVPEAEPVAAED